MPTVIEYLIIKFISSFQSSPPRNREQDVPAQPGDGLWADVIASCASDGKAAQGRIGVEYGGCDGSGGDSVLLPAGSG